MKRNKFRSGIAVIAAAAVTLSQGTGFTAFAESYRVIEDPFFPGVTSYVYISDPYSDIQDPVRYYEPISPKKVNSAADAKKANAKAAELPINSANFPDANFRAYVSENFDTDGSGGLSDEEINYVQSINLSWSTISSLKGIEYFKNLTELSCWNNNLKNLDVSKNTKLASLICVDNNLTNLDVSKNTALETLSLENNSLTNLDVSQNTALTFLSCSNNNLKELDVSKNMALETLYCFINNISNLDVSKNTVLTDLDCGYNNITNLDVSKNTALKKLDCWDTNLSSLDLSKNTALEELNCENNNLTSLDISGCAVLTDLHCNNNNLSLLDVSNNTALVRLYCGNNNLTSLDISNNTNLKYFSCFYNYLMGKDKIKGLNENALEYFVYNPQYIGTAEVTGVGENAIPDGAQLYVTDVTDTEKVDLKNVSKVYDISLKSGGVEIQPNNDIAVTIPVPEKVNGEKAKVYRKEANGSFTDMKAVYNPQSKTLTFVTDHLSIYAITGGDVLLGDVNGDGRINNTDIILLGRSYMAGTGAQYLDIADMNNDNTINNADIILLGRLYMSITQ